MKESNKWTINQEGNASWSYIFPIRNIDYYTVLQHILVIGYETRFFVLKKEGGKNKFHDLLIQFINFLKNSYLKKGAFPSIFSAYPSNDLNEGNNVYYFSSSHWFYDENGEISEQEVSYLNIRNLLKRIGHKYNKAGIVPLMHMTSGINKNLDGTITDIDFTFYLNSDIWAPMVPCIDCEREFTNEEIRKYGWDVRKKYWHSNLELAKLNVVRLNEFMQKMLAFTKSNGGYCELNEGGLSIYEDILTDEGIIL